MEKITSVLELKAAIGRLEIKQTNDMLLLREQFRITYESVKPLNVLKGAIEDFHSTPDLKGDVLASLIGISMGATAKKLMIGRTMNPVKILFGASLQMFVTGVITRHAGAIRSVAAQLIKKISRNKNTADD
jgi:hypothetical protein